MDILNEATKEVLFGGAVGLAAGYISKKAGNQLVGILLGELTVLVCITRCCEGYRRCT